MFSGKSEWHGEFFVKLIKNAYFNRAKSIFLQFKSMEHELNEREREILRYVICRFIESAAPVASRYISKHHYLELSAATIRNVLSDLEEMGYIHHPHTSAGSIPTDKGYRYFVDWLMEIQNLSSHEKGNIKKQLVLVSEANELLKEAARLLGSISHQLSVVSSLHLSAGILERIELVSIASHRILVVLEVKSGIIKTITMEISVEISLPSLLQLNQYLNERLCGLTLQTIRDSFAERVKDYDSDTSGLLNTFIRSADRIFDDSKEREKLHIGGTQSLLEQPEYGEPDNIRTIIELINDETVLSNVIESAEIMGSGKGVALAIGEEHKNAKLKNYSIILKTYKVGEVYGTIGILGPKRMNYAKVIPLVNYVAHEVSTSLS
ncbi:MAG: heat-inducible transcription repressor HrcA [Bacteroidetes bacterium]|nr:MAG: heat-inducible transcription repressor HrcA [Bacteroidota bacterium]